MLLLFDIDGTLLLRASVEHRAALHVALAEIYGVTDPAVTPVNAAGRTDLDIAREICLLSGVSAERIDADRDDFRAAAVAAYADLCPEDLGARVAPGVERALQTLAAREGVVLSLLTGNLEPIARLKLLRAGLGRFFAAGQGAFGSDHEDRSRLPEIARRRAGAYPRERTVVIGDTPRDIACARADGVRAIAVATGPYRADELSAADIVLASAGELPSVL